MIDNAANDSVAYTHDALMTAVPDFLDEVWRRDSRRPTDLLAAVESAGLSVDDAARAASVTPSTPFRLSTIEPGDKAFERRLRAAVTKRFGRSSGDDRAWNIGRFRAGVIATSRGVEVRLFAVYAVTELRPAVADWLDGMDAAEWAVRHRFVDSRAAEHSAADASREHFFPRSARFVLDDEEGPHASLLVPATTRAPGSHAADDAGRLADIEQYLTDAVGPATGGRWERNGRSFVLRASTPSSRRAYIALDFATTAGAGASSPAAASSPPRDDAAIPAAHLATAIPALLDDLWTRETRDPAAIADALRAAGLPVDDDAVAARRPYLRFAFSDAGTDAGAAAFERRLRTAVTKRVGKPSGSDKHWHLGGLSAALVVGRRGVTLNLSPEYSATELRDAAADWLQGADAAAWAVRHGYLDDRAALEKAAEPRHFTPSAARVYLDSSPGPRASFFLPPGIRPPGTKPADDDTRFDAVLQYLAEALGPSTREGRWEREGRAFGIRRMRSRTRSVEFRSI